MTSRDFCFWLQGFFEIRKPGAITDTESELIERHLGLVFKHEIDPTVTPAEREAHDGVGPLRGDDLRRHMEAPGNRGSSGHSTVYC